MIDFTKIPETALPYFKGGKETFFARFAGDANCKILTAVSPQARPSASIPMRTPPRSSSFCRAKAQCF